MVLRILVICIFVFSSTVFSVLKTIDNPQTLMVDARSTSLGITPVLEGDLGNVMLNPAGVSSINTLPLSITNQRLYGEYNYFVASTGMPRFIPYKKGKKDFLQRVGFSLSYGHVVLNDIPMVVAYNDMPYQIGEYSSGFRVFHTAVGTEFYDWLQLDRVSVGSALKLVNFFVGAKQSSTVGLDVGLIGSREIKYKYLDNILASISLHNVIAPSLKISGTDNEALLPFRFYLGTRLNMLQERLGVLTTLNEFGITLGSEFFVERGLFVRGSTNFSDIKLGLGVELEDIPTGINNYNLKGRADFTYSQAAFPMNADPTYVLSIASLGRAIPRQPQILKPANLITYIPERSMHFSGVGPKNTTIRIYNNGEYYQSTLSDSKGRWRIKNFSINEGENKLYIQSYDLEKDFSVKSNLVTVVSDTTPPELDVSVFPEGNLLNFIVQSNEELSSVSGVLDGSKIRLRRDKDMLTEEIEDPVSKDLYLKDLYRYIGRSEIPKTLREGSPPPTVLNRLNVFASDESGNSIETGKLSFFGTLQYPLDKHVHYSESLRTIGLSSDLTAGIYVNKNRVLVDSENRFSFPVDLEPGKNVLELVFEAKNNTVFTFYGRVLRLLTYDDMTPKVKGRREIEFLSTLGFLQGDDDGNFYPERNVTRQYITKIMTLALKEPIEEVAYDLFLDVPQDHPFASYIQAGLTSGYIFAFPDGTFKPEQEITLNEAVDLLSSAGVIEFVDVEDGDRLVTRAQLAEFLAYTPKIERQISNLINWEKGYEVKR